MDKQKELIDYLKEVYETAPQKHVSTLSGIIQTLEGGAVLSSDYIKEYLPTLKLSWPLVRALTDGAQTTGEKAALKSWKEKMELRAEAEREQREIREGWPLKVMGVLERACGHGFDIHVKEGVFVVSAADYTKWCLSLTAPNNLWDNDLTELEYQLDRADEKQREWKRQKELKQAALAKLSEAERKALGL